MRETAAGPAGIVHRSGLAKLHCVIGEPRIGVWFNPDSGVYSSEYLDALLVTRL